MSGSADRPNIVLILTDQQSANMMSCAGNEYLETPGMDRLADTGVRFGRTYCTNPVCLPSRYSLMTGRFPSELRIRKNDHSHIESIPEEIRRTGLGHCLRDVGYDTAYGGKVHLPKMTPEDLGFEVITENGRDGLADACVEYVQQDRENPFFLVASFINPHDICFMALRDYRETVGEGPPSHSDAAERLDRALRRPDGVGREEFFTEHCPPLPENHEPQDDEPGAIQTLLDRRPFRQYIRDEWTPRQWRLHRWAYCRLTEMVDAHVRRILDAVEDANGTSREETLVIFTSDHGDLDGAHRLEHKTAFYEEAVRVPLIISQPGRTPAGRVDDHLVSNGLDLLPTICDYGGAEIPDHCAGRSLRPLADGAGPDEWRSHVRLENEVGDMVVSDRYKYARFEMGDHPEQLYDLQEDPGETRNWIDEPGHRPALRRLRNRLDAAEQSG